MTGSLSVPGEAVRLRQHHKTDRRDADKYHSSDSHQRFAARMGLKLKVLGVCLPVAVADDVGQA